MSASEFRTVVVVGPDGKSVSCGCYMTDAKGDHFEPGTKVWWLCREHDLDAAVYRLIALARS